MNHVTIVGDVRGPLGLRSQAGDFCPAAVCRVLPERRRLFVSHWPASYLDCTK